jgi:hypothetical protein
MTKRKDPIVQIPESLCKRKRRLKSVDIEELESGQESHDVRKRAKLGRDIFDLGDNASTASLHADDSPRPMNIIIGAPGGVDCNEEVETKNKAINSSKVSAQLKSKSTSTKRKVRVQVTTVDVYLTAVLTVLSRRRCSKDSQVQVTSAKICLTAGFTNLIG